MGCCGKKRNDLNTRVNSPVRRALQNEVARPEAVVESEVARHAFQYMGATALTVRGPATGRTYRFAKRGALVIIDERDAPFLVAVPNLRRTERQP